MKNNQQEVMWERSGTLVWEAVQQINVKTES